MSVRISAQIITHSHTPEVNQVIKRSKQGKAKLSLSDATQRIISGKFPHFPFWAWRPKINQGGNNFWRHGSQSETCCNQSVHLARVVRGTGPLVACLRGAVTLSLPRIPVHWRFRGIPRPAICENTECEERIFAGTWRLNQLPTLLIQVSIHRAVETVVIMTCPSDWFPV